MILPFSLDIPCKDYLGGSCRFVSNLDKDLLSKVRFDKIGTASRKKLESDHKMIFFSKYINIPPPPVTERIRKIKSDMAEVNFTNKWMKLNLLANKQKDTACGEKYYFQDSFMYYDSHIWRF